MIRRVQNRGYATMSRIADHVERLTAGDESNAVIDAGDAVSLMTVHAAKGLEFPVVFVVNLSRGTSSRRPAIRVGGSGGGDNESWLSVGEFQSEADEDARERDREETKRLLYVAVTRARDRLYLASEVKNAKFRAAAGSLGEVLPDGLRATFEAAAALQWDSSGNVDPGATRWVEWAARSGDIHRLIVCQPSLDAPRASEVAHRRERTGPDDFSGVDDGVTLPRVAVTSHIRPERPTVPAP